MDLVDYIEGMYRILDLISEQGSNGLVDKIIIDQESTGRFINDLKPGAYKDLTKVDFKAMDEIHVKPLGVYGSKSEIVRFLRKLNVIDDRTKTLLHAPQDVSSDSPTLRSGLYVLTVQGSTPVERCLYVIFWPEDMTWDDNAISTVQRNRITFMRYLTKITDQIIVLISDAHGRALVWEDLSNTREDSSSALTFDKLEEEVDRLFTFEVSKANEQEENVRMHPGFEIKHPLLKEASVTEFSPVNESRLQTRLVVGDTKQGILTITCTEHRQVKEDFWEVSRNPMQFESYLFRNDTALRFDKDLPYDSIMLLVRNGLRNRYPEAIEAFEQRDADIRKHQKEERKNRSGTITKDIESEKPRLAAALETYFVSKVLAQFPKLNEAVLRGKAANDVPSQEQKDLDKEYLKVFFERYPLLWHKLVEVAPDDKFSSLKAQGSRFSRAMKKVLLCNHLFSHSHLPVSERKKVWRLVDSNVDSRSVKNMETFLKNDDSDSAAGILQLLWTLLKFVRGLLPSVTGLLTEPDGLVKDARAATHDLKAADFFSTVDNILQDWPELTDGVNATFNVANEYFAKNIKDALRLSPHKLIHEHTQYCKDMLEQELGAGLNDSRNSSCSKLFDELENAYKSEGDRKHVIVIEKLERVTNRNSYCNSESYRASGYHLIRSEPILRFTLHPLELTEHDKQQMQMNSFHVPRPSVSSRGACNFSLPVGASISLIQLLEGDKCLVVVDDQDQDLHIYLENLSSLEAAMKRKEGAKKRIKREKTGNDVVVAYDEGRRALVVCGVDIQKPSVQLQCFCFDERYTTLQGQGSAINLTSWYADSIPKIVNVHFVSGSDEFALVEESGRVRIFSSVTQQFRPAILQLPAPPLSTFGTPDGSCLCAILPQDNGLSLRVYHWASFGPHKGFPFDIPTSSRQLPLISAFGERNNIHLIWIDLKDSICRSIGLKFTRQITEFQFREKHSKNSTHGEERRTLHNSLIDCHSDVWTRFPVIPAVQRQAIVSSELRKDKSLLFITPARNVIPFADYFDDMIQKFEKTTKKPTSSLLSCISVSAELFLSAVAGLQTQDGWSPVSSYKAGEWMVDIFCLIPIHIAIARDNRFIPLKDGVWARDVEKTLLGADVGRVADSLSFGWYESIFQSYMSTKPVKVVSSMGEQSVGKSFALNHLADTSFAGSAMRTTEGVWMSVTPTDADLIVALDFEGVHSIERSAQEDTLLVLFNAAISNLVLFRNNFAMSRDITNLFQSFQASSSVLDPDTNPSLFQSTLVIIIKDVVDSDRIEIAREFKLKLHRIVQEEQASNFISRLYRGRLNIIPWPVIESRQFYTLFTTLKQHLDNQSPTHEGAGTFLLKLKMLMAKLKTNDWGALTQNMSTHRAQHLLSLLPRALAFGATELEPDVEPLKNFDTSLVIDAVDSPAVFYLADLEKEQGDKVDNLRRLFHFWPDFASRHHKSDLEWTNLLSSFLENLLEQRVAHVQTWIDSNLSHFNGSNAAIEDLHRTVDSKVIEVRRTVQLCKLRCEQCHLLCIKTRFHEGDHDCSTNHECSHSCQFVDEHDGSPEACSLPAGHGGKHVCDPTSHLCGQQCDLRDRKGCQGSCTKVASHDETVHMCSGRRHSCGKPCSLQNVKSPDGKMYTCQGLCSVLWNEEHDSHVCDAIMACPIACQLCGRLCSEPDHLHGLDSDAIHLCGQEHKCSSLCSSNGVCEIDTVPQSIEAAFNGAHDRFQYTKYSQATKRLQCAVVIAPGRLEHDGAHVHSRAPNPFHYCDARCASCAYVCTLPQGHSQPEHSTSHGSMSRTRWAVDGPNGTVVEFDGHKFESNDDGAPMLCNVMCSKMGHHAHIDYCRTSDPTACNDADLEHIKCPIEPNPDKPKDWITHELYWRRLGNLLDPYSKEDQENFAKCDAMCSGPEHQATATSAAQPSYCSLPIFHPPATLSQVPSGSNGYLSNDGHVFLCKNPALLLRAFHVIFVIDRSGSMSSDDRVPLPNHPASARIARVANNRLGAVYSALHSFWSAQEAAINQASAATRRDAYSAVLFTGSALEVFNNDFSSSPDGLLDKLLNYSADGGTNFNAALTMTQSIMERHWSTERCPPIVIFLSDGECDMTEEVMYDLCRKAVSLGRALSFQAISFGPEGESARLRRMSEIAKEVQSRAPRDPLLPANAVMESAYSVALDSVRLSETVLGIVESLRKTRGGLIR
ncbi:hypothetical protein DFH11DRAFT_1508479 [Phellopilus nigrolimitatus]|nr:hypothetical protein DFH11DRAFT_1508479 [Phellopilus nigrolimitatus]